MIMKKNQINIHCADKMSVVLLARQLSAIYHRSWFSYCDLLVFVHVPCHIVIEYDEWQIPFSVQILSKASFVSMI